MFPHLHTGQVQGAQAGGGKGEEGRVIIPLGVEQKGGGGVKRTDETFEAHIDMLL